MAVTSVRSLRIVSELPERRETETGEEVIIYFSPTRGRGALKIDLVGGGRGPAYNKMDPMRSNVL